MSSSDNSMMRFLSPGQAIARNAADKPLTIAVDFDEWFPALVTNVQRHRLWFGPLFVVFSPQHSSGALSLEQRKRLFVVVKGDEIIVTNYAGFRAAYCRRPNHPRLIVRRRTDTDDHEVLVQAWQAANDKARELGWIV
jgi:hypothetical protein